MSLMKTIFAYFKKNLNSSQPVVPDDIFKLPLKKSLEHRLPWLLLGMLGGILAAKIIGSFELVLKKNLILAAFIPLIVYMSDAVGTQLEAFIIRDLTVNPKFKFSRYFFKQGQVLGLLALVISLILYIITYFLYADLKFSLVLSVALFVAVFSSVLTGLLMPYLFSRFRFDPANASGPIATVIQDILSVLIYFLVAGWWL